jgi:hypothetical protein
MQESPGFRGTPVCIICEKVVREREEKESNEGSQPSSTATTQIYQQPPATQSAHAVAAAAPGWADDPTFAAAAVISTDTNVLISKCIDTRESSIYQDSRPI